MSSNLSGKAFRIIGGINLGPTVFIVSMTVIIIIKLITLKLMLVSSIIF